MSNKKAPFVLCSIILLAVTVFMDVVLCAQTQPTGRPNILFIIADDMSWPHAGVYGDKVVKTPSIDRLARQGVLFDLAYSASASCTISRNVLLTGQQPWSSQMKSHLPKLSDINGLGKDVTFAAVDTGDHSDSMVETGIPMPSKG
jgi:arylsulfatase A-like enzyme